MITRILQGIPFNVISPSFYELASHPCVDISFVGDKWFACCPGPDGEPLLRPFPTRDAAVSAIALALNC